MATPSPFDPPTYDHQLIGSRRSAAVVVPIIVDLLEPASVVDFGAGVGAWLAAFRDVGITDVIGLEGGHPEPQQLQVPTDVISQCDLTRPVNLHRHFDLALSLEVAEHLPHGVAAAFVSSLSMHADAVLFSAAIPDQGGHDHINEEWPDVWADRFASYEFECFDPFRWKLWADDRIEWWYRQNILVFARHQIAARLRAAGLVAETPRRLVHPELYTQTCAALEAQVRHQQGLRQSISSLRGAVLRRLSR